MTEQTIEQRTEWLKEFSHGHSEAVYAIGIVTGLAEDLYAVGLDGVADKLKLPLHILRSSVTEMNDSVSRMISEDFQHSLRTTDETFVALLRSLSTTGHEGSKTER